MSKNIYPVISKYPGAKSGYVGKVIAEILPYDGIQKYYEVFGGMANILLHKAPHPEEYYNDKDLRLTVLMEVLADEKKSKRLFDCMLDTTQYYNQSSFDYAQFVCNHMIDPNSEFMRNYAYDHELDEVEKAVAVWRTLLMSFNGEMKFFSGVREVTKDGIEFEIKANHVKGNEALRLEEQIQKKIDITERLRGVSILNMDAFELIDCVKGDSTALMVCDSPYTLEERKAKKIYKNEMSNKQQSDYVTLLYDSKAKALVCGYDNKIYDEILLRPGGSHTWYKYEVAEVAKNMSRNFGGIKTRVTEIIWTNWKII